MTETDKMEELFERLPWLREEFETEQEILELLALAEHEYLKARRELGRSAYLD